MFLVTVKLRKKSVKKLFQNFKKLETTESPQKLKNNLCKKAQAMFTSIVKLIVLIDNSQKRKLIKKTLCLFKKNNTLSDHLANLMLLLLGIKLTVPIDNSQKRKLIQERQ